MTVEKSNAAAVWAGVLLSAAVSSIRRVSGNPRLSVSAALMARRPFFNTRDLAARSLGAIDSSSLMRCPRLVASLVIRTRSASSGVSSRSVMVGTSLLDDGLCGVGCVPVFQERGGQPCGGGIRLGGEGADDFQ